jgi:Uma2 family endonuclease
MTVLVNDPWLAKQLVADRECSDHAALDEVWDGVYVVSPSPNMLHQRVLVGLMKAFSAVTEDGDEILPAINVSDREEGWLQNFRVPDLSVILRSNPAKELETHRCGGPDLVVEIVSPDDSSREKRSFYAKIGVREMLVIDRAPWAVELYRLEGEELNLVGRSTPDHPESIGSQVLPVAFSIEEGVQRPQIVVTRAGCKERWMI